MAGLALQSQFYDDFGVPYQILIYDKDLSSGFGAQLAHTVKGSIVLSDEGDDNNPFKRIIPKKLTWTILMYSPDYTELQREACLDFYTGITTSPEGRYYVILKSDTVTLFRGKVLADVGDLVLNYHKDLKLDATDGLLQLKDIDYRPTDYSDQVPTELIKVSTFVQHFTDILSRNDVVDFFYNDPLFEGTTDAVFTTSTNWEPTSPTALTGDVFKYVSKRNTYFKQQEGRLYREYSNCYDALKDLITGFNARMIFADGAYHMEALGYQDNLTLVRYGYDYTGTATTGPGNKTTHDISDNDDIFILADPALKHMPPFKAVSLKQNKKYNNILSGLDIWFHRTDTDNRGPHNLGYVIGAGNTLIMDLRFEMIYTNPVHPSIFINYVEIELSIQLGDYYLSNDLSTHFVTGVDPKDLLWTLTPSTFKMQILHSNNYPLPNFPDYPIKMISDEIPEDGEFIISIVSWRYIDPFGGDTAFTSDFIKLTLSKRTRIFASTNGIDGLLEVPDNTIIYEIGDIKNSIVYPEELTYHDTEVGGVAGFNSLLLVVPAGPITQYLTTTEWTDDDMGVTLPIQELLLKQMLGMRKIPNKVVRLTIQRNDQTLMHFDDRYALGTDLCIPVKCVHNVDSGTYAMSLWSPVKDYDGVNIVRWDEDQPVGPYYIGSELELMRPINPGLQRCWKFTGVTDTYVTIDEALGFYIGGSTAPEEIECYFSVYHNGVYQEYIDYTSLTFPLTPGDILPGQYTVEPDTDTFHFAYCENDTIIIKYIKV